jgi:hypothetical protein
LIFASQVDGITGICNWYLVPRIFLKTEKSSGFKTVNLVLLEFNALKSLNSTALLRLNFILQICLFQSEPGFQAF